MDIVTIHASKKSVRVAKFIKLDNFTNKFIEAYNNASIYSVYYNSKNEVIALDIWNKEHKNILK